MKRILSIIALCVLSLCAARAEAATFTYNVGSGSLGSSNWSNPNAWFQIPGGTGLNYPGGVSTSDSASLSGGTVTVDSIFTLSNGSCSGSAQVLLTSASNSGFIFTVNSATVPAWRQTSAAGFGMIVSGGTQSVTTTSAGTLAMGAGAAGGIGQTGGFLTANGSQTGIAFVGGAGAGLNSTGGTFSVSAGTSAAAGASSPGIKVSNGSQGNIIVGALVPNANPYSALIQTSGTTNLTPINPWLTSSGTVSLSNTAGALQGVDYTGGAIVLYFPSLPAVANVSSGTTYGYTGNLQTGTAAGGNQGFIEFMPKAAKAFDLSEIIRQQPPAEKKPIEPMMGKGNLVIAGTSEDAAWPLSKIMEPIITNLVVLTDKNGRVLPCPIVLRKDQLPPPNPAPGQTYNDEGGREITPSMLRDRERQKEASQ